jgi:hypothetical protein
MLCCLLMRICQPTHRAYARERRRACIQRALFLTSKVARSLPRPCCCHTYPEHAVQDTMSSGAYSYCTTGFRLQLVDGFISCVRHGSPQTAKNTGLYAITPKCQLHHCTAGNSTTQRNRMSAILIRTFCVYSRRKRKYRLLRNRKRKLTWIIKPFQSRLRRNARPQNTEDVVLIHTRTLRRQPLKIEILAAPQFAL